MPLNLKSTKCARFSLVCRFNEKSFRKSAFVRDTGSKINARDKISTWTYGSDNARVSEHAHLMLVLDGEDSFAHITYHPGKSETPDVRPPYLEEFPQWLATFFKVPKLKIELSAAFQYDGTYESVLQLRYPILVSDELFKDALLVGHQIEFPSSPTGIERIFLSSVEKETYVVVNGESEIGLSTSDFKTALKRLSIYSKTLVRKHTDNV